MIKFYKNETDYGYVISCGGAPTEYLMTIRALLKALGNIPDEALKSDDVYYITQLIGDMLPDEQQITEFAENEYRKQLVSMNELEVMQEELENYRREIETKEQALYLLQKRIEYSECYNEDKERIIKAKESILQDKERIICFQQSKIDKLKRQLPRTKKVIKKTPIVC